ncbi:MAG: ferritin-like domain-containing protein [Candidatus Obscuribacterales bacterium]|nr:ferritin-like domain-containing protein [Candidatus Obscuribacterales bacterium]
MDDNEHRKQLIHVLHMAYSGELAAGIAYAGHWRSLRDEQQRTDIKKIESEEWTHRMLVGQMLKQLGAKPQRWREAMMTTIGSSVFVACFIGGWFLPMYFAGRLESANNAEYEHAAFHAEALGLLDMKAILLELAEVELTHEQFFKDIVQGHKLLPLMIQHFEWGSIDVLESKPAETDP